jgi:hypothetical protein
MGLFVRESELEGAAVFRVHEFGGLMVTQDVVDFVSTEGSRTSTSAKWGDDLKMRRRHNTAARHRRPNGAPAYGT